MILLRTLVIEWLGRLFSRPQLPAPAPGFKSTLAAAIQSTSTVVVDAGLVASVANLRLGSLVDAAHPQAAPGTPSDYDYGDDQFDLAAEWAASSTLAHSTDAWRYLSSALRAMFSGYPSVARHLAYYSELRSAFAILARHGVLIRSNSHVILRADRTVVSLAGAGTHEAVWQALKAWMKTADAKKFFLEGIFLDQGSLSDWTAAQGTDEFLERPMDEILRLIGYDLREFTLDRARRNASSYGATDLRGLRGPSDLEWLVTGVQDFWSAAEPMFSRGFERLDAQFCLRVLLSARQAAGKSMKPERVDSDFTKFASDLGAAQPRVIGQQAASVNDLLGSTVFEHAFSRDPAAPEAAGMIARAVILARFATLAVDGLIVDSGLDISDLDPWAASVGIEAGLWSSTSPTSLAELWHDSEFAASEMLPFSGEPTLSEFMRQANGRVFGATSFGLLSLWWRRNWNEPLPVS
jgi:hypothetical protein